MPITYLLSYSLQAAECFLRPNMFAASQEISRIVWNPNVPYRIQKCPPTVPILRQLDPVHTSTSHLLKFQLHVILSYVMTITLPKFTIYFRYV